MVLTDFSAHLTCHEYFFLEIGKGFIYCRSIVHHFSKLLSTMPKEELRQGMIQEV
eukprot:UN20833